MIESGSVTLEVVGGRYKGVVQSLGRSTYTIGSDIGCDIIFSETSVAPKHASISIDETSIIVEAFSDGVVLQEYGVVKLSSKVSSDFPVKLLIGDVDLLLIDESDDLSNSSKVPILSSGSRNFRSLIAVSVAGSVLIGGSFYSGYFQNGSKSSRSTIAVSSLNPGFGNPVLRNNAEGSAISGTDQLSKKIGNLKLPAAAFLKQSASQALSTMDDAVIASREQAKKLSLSGVDVKAGPGMVLVSGSVDPSEMPAWQQMQQWFDTSYQGKIQLVSKVEMQMEKPLRAPSIDAVWNGVHPYLVIRGEKYFPGATLEGGWQIDRIDTDRMVLVRNGKPATFRF